MDRWVKYGKVKQMSELESTQQPQALQPEMSPPELEKPYDAREDAKQAIDKYTLPSEKSLKDKLGVEEVPDKHEEEEGEKIFYSYATTIPQEGNEGQQHPNMEMMKIDVRDMDGVDSAEEWKKGTKKNELNEKGLLDVNVLFGGSRMYGAFMEWGVRNGVCVPFGEKKNVGQDDEYVADRGYVLKKGVNQEQAYKTFLASSEGKIAIAQNLEDETRLNLKKVEEVNDGDKTQELLQFGAALEDIEMDELRNVIRSSGESGVPRIVQDKIRALRNKETELVTKNDQGSKLLLEAVRLQIHELENEIEMAMKGSSSEVENQQDFGEEKQKIDKQREMVMLKRIEVVQSLNEMLSKAGKPLLTSEQRELILTQADAERVLRLIMIGNGSSSDEVEETLQELALGLGKESLREVGSLDKLLEEVLDEEKHEDEEEQLEQVKNGKEHVGEENQDGERELELDELQKLAAQAEGDENRRLIQDYINKKISGATVFLKDILKGGTSDFLRYLLYGDRRQYGLMSENDPLQEGEGSLDTSEMINKLSTSPEKCIRIAENVLTHVAGGEVAVKIKLAQEFMKSKGDAESVPPEEFQEVEGDKVVFSLKKYKKWLTQEMNVALDSSRDQFVEEFKKQLFAEDVKEGRIMEDGKIKNVKAPDLHTFMEKFRITNETLRAFLVILGEKL